MKPNKNRLLLAVTFTIACTITCMTFTTANAHTDGQTAHNHPAGKPTIDLQANTISPSATYLGNEGVMITSGDMHSTKPAKITKVLFDPFFHNNYSIYQLVPRKIHQAIMKGEKPYDDIDALFISHAHGDHFSAEDTIEFLRAHPKTKLVAPKQAVDALIGLKNSAAVMSQVTSVALDYGDKPWSKKLGDLMIEAVRVPHAGWPGRATVENIVFRVTLNDQVTVMHMGDADPDDSHFKPFKAHWMQRQTDTAFPPYWFLTSAQGNLILNQRINAVQHIGVHVPVKVPLRLQQSGKDYFTVPGEQRIVGGG
ncbi:MAG: L-ascorbate metabolism protein UlaG (beta-lactamase superfamily) [Phenylobacterium sp.]|jgi:L-ascorbate metabolism protein UlaG (beta-lactamase superfamily)